MSFTFNPVYPDATDEQKWDQIRLWRNAELANTDWTQITDSPVDKSIWADYRQALRDLPNQGSKVDKVDLPIKPV